MFFRCESLNFYLFGGALISSAMAFPRQSRQVSGAIDALQIHHQQLAAVSIANANVAAQPVVFLPHPASPGVFASAAIHKPANGRR